MNMIDIKINGLVWGRLRFLFILLICSMSTSGQNSIEFEHLSTVDGLSQNDVNCIYQDKQGFMWFGTHDGLNRYDGYSFKVFKPNPNDKNSISSNLIWDITEDDYGNLWVGTTGNGLNLYDKTTEKFTRFKHDDFDKHSIVDNTIRALFADSKNRLWIGTAKGIDMVKLDVPLDSIKFRHFKLSSNDISVGGKNANSINDIFEDSNGQIWLAGGKGLHRLSHDENGSVYFPRVNAMIGLPKYTPVKNIVEDAFGRILISSSKGGFMIQLDQNVYKAIRFVGKSYGDLAVSGDYLWGGSTRGLSNFSNNRKNKKPKKENDFTYNPRFPTKSLSKNNVTSIFVDNTGIVWIGVNGGGINKYDPTRKQFETVRKTLDPKSLSNDKVRSIYEDSNGTLWVGTEGGGVNVMQKKNAEIEGFEFVNFAVKWPVYSLKEVRINNRKKMLLGTQGPGAMYEVDITDNKEITKKDFKKINEFNSSLFSIEEDSFGNLWFATYGAGVYRWLVNKETNDFKKDILSFNRNQEGSISSNIIRKVFVDKDKNVWFGTGDGLCKLDVSESLKKNPVFEIFKNIPDDATSISHNYILNIFQSSTGDLWIGTFGGGLNKVVVDEATGKTTFEVFSEVNGLPNNVIKGILEDDGGNLWLATNKGLSKFNPVNKSFKNFDVNDGLQNDEFGELAAWKTKEGKLMFGGVSGFNIFDPNTIKNNKVSGETVITGFSIFNKPIDIGEEVNGRVILTKAINEIGKIDLKYSENSFSFEFASLHFAAPKKNMFAYKLEGFNKHWVYTNSDKRFATYTNLEPGEYTLHVKASNNDGVWDPTPTKLKIKVIPPWWSSNLAKTGYLILFVLSLFGFRRYTLISSSKKHDLELEHLEKEQHEEIHRLKLEFFTNISHEFRTPLTLIRGPLDYLRKKGDSISKKEISEQYELMFKNVDYLLRLVNQLLDFRKMDKGKMDLVLGESDMVSFVKGLGEPFQFLSLKKKINFEISSDKKKISSWFDSNALEKIINNLLSNAFKFTPENGSVVLMVHDGETFQMPDGIKQVENQSKYVVIQVKDSGPGIPKHRIQHIFERFYTQVGKANLDMKGTGIGLSFTKKLVEHHSGIIDVKSDPSYGTSFFVFLPKEKEMYHVSKDVSFRDGDESEPLVGQTDAETHVMGVLDDIVDQNISRSRSQLPVLLIVDDNPDIRSFIKKGLGESYYIYEAENGEKGFEIANKVVPNIIITDLMMPIMDGVELCGKLKTTKETSHIPVVMLTAKTSEESEIEGLKIGADAYIRKPFDMELLELKLSNILKHRQKLRKVFNREIVLQPKDVTVTSTDETFLQKAIEIVEKHMMNSEFSVELLVKEMALSRSNLFLKIKELTGLSSSEFIRNIRLKRAVQLLEKSDLSVKEVMYMTGFNTASYFSKCFKKQFGVIPSKYVRQADRTSEDSEDTTA